ncbi:hypothetical protein SLEP1_g23421 [Rubroshorea leprosula]|uniref:Uncharacterized protein n=1 Tax=Rubroshorea leprosula TaxID=152421 RepID=A0AAV5JCC0_9ROSI|nr:hypothetical protein SLEP1_g23421 [Rubroshorea leprosula]
MSKDLLVPPSKLLANGKQIQSSWSSPPPGVLKVNVDASFMPNLGSAALAMVGRNSNCEICFGKTWFCMAISPLMVEAGNKIIYETEARGFNPGLIVLLLVGSLLLIFLVGNHVLYMYAQKTLPPRKTSPSPRRRWRGKG